MVVLRTFVTEIEITLQGVIDSMGKESVRLQIMDLLVGDDWFAHGLAHMNCQCDWLH